MVIYNLRVWSKKPQMKSSTKKIVVICIIVLFVVSIVAGALAGHL